MSKYALDSSALIALHNSEPGADLVLSILQGSALSAVNLAEVVTKLSDWGSGARALDRILTRGEVEIFPFTDPQARLSGGLRRATKSRGLSLGDRACLALAMERGLTAVTADAAWVGATAVPVLLIRTPKS